MKRFQKVPTLKFYFSIVHAGTDLERETSVYKAMIPMDVQKHQHFYLMDQDGQHEYVPMYYLQNYDHVGNVISHGAANGIKKLLVELNTKDDEVGACQVISDFNTVARHELTRHDELFLGAVSRTVRFTEKGYFF